MADLQREGKVRWIGVSNFSVAQMERARKIAPITSLQPPYSMINRGVQGEILPWCKKHGIGVINYSPMVSGLLTGAMTKERVAAMPDDDFRKRAKKFQEPNLSTQSRTVGSAEADRRTSWCQCRCRRNCVDAAQSGDNRGDCRRPQRKAG